MKLRDGRVKAEEDQIAAALEGNWREEHLFFLSQALDSYRHYSRQIEQFEQKLTEVAAKVVAKRTDANEGSDHGDDSPGDANKGSKAGSRKWNVDMRDAMKGIYGVDLMCIPGVGFE